MKKGKLSKSNIFGLVILLGATMPLLAGCVPAELRAAASGEEATDNE